MATASGIDPCPHVFRCSYFSAIARLYEDGIYGWTWIRKHYNTTSTTVVLSVVCLRWLSATCSPIRTSQQRQEQISRASPYVHNSSTANSSCIQKRAPHDVSEQQRYDSKDIHHLERNHDETGPHLFFCAYSVLCQTEQSAHRFAIREQVRAAIKSPQFG